LRRATTLAEFLLWRRIRNRQLDGFKFVRQEPIGPYYADFVCRERHLIVEVDGSQHFDSARDRRRDADLGALGYRIIRVWNSDVLRNIAGVFEMLQTELGTAPHPSPLPARGERERAGDEAAPGIT
jgi:very-short-patch-repair endonuclease